MASSVRYVIESDDIEGDMRVEEANVHKGAYSRNTMVGWSGRPLHIIRRDAAGSVCFTIELTLLLERIELGNLRASMAW